MLESKFSRKFFLYRFLPVLFIVIGIIGTIAVVYASQQQNNTLYRIAVDKHGNLRLLHPDIKGKSSDELKKNEFMIELPSSELVTLLETKLNEHDSTISELGENIAHLENIITEQGITMSALGDNITQLRNIITEQGVTISELENIINQQATAIAGLEGRIGELESTVSGQGSIISGLESSISDLEDTISNLENAISDLENRVSELEGISDNVTSEGLVLWLPMDEGQGSVVVEDKSEFGNDGTIVGATWVGLNGAYALSFDGSDDYVDLSAVIDSFKTMTEGTIIIWAKADNVVGSKALISMSHTADASSDCCLQLNGNNFRFRVRDGGVTSLDRQTSGGSISANKFYNCAVAVSTSGNVLYLDGETPAITDTKGNSTTQKFFADIGTPDSFKIGISEDSGGLEWDMAGTIGEVWVYNRALTPQEIQDIYLSTKWRYQ